MSTSKLTTTATTLLVSENSAATSIDIAAPVDTNYASSQLTVKVKSLPTDGTIYLANGLPIFVGETLTVSQLTALLFRPASGKFNQSSTFSYTVKDPSGVVATGSATLKIAPDTSPPVTAPASLTVAENAAATAIGIAAPTDPNYAASQLKITVTGLPSDGTVYLADGTTAVTNGENLTVAQLTGLTFKPTAGAFSESSIFSYKVSDP